MHKYLKWICFYLIYNSLKNFCLILLCTFIVGSISAQKIKVNREVDKFTKSEVVETSSKRLYTKNFMGTGYTNIFECAIRKVDGVYSMPASILMHDVVKYDENSGVMFLLSNDETVVLITNYIGIGAERLGNGFWFNTSFMLSPSDVEKLKNNNIISVRVNYVGGYFDYDLKTKNQGIVAEMLKLVDAE